MTFRLDKYVSDSLNITRKNSLILIKRKEITVDGVIVNDPSVHIDSETNRIEYNGKVITPRTDVWIMLNKPDGVISAVSDKREKTVLDLIPEELSAKNLFPCGRLDKDTTGLLLITNDGKLAHSLLLPRNQIKKRYYFVTDVEYSDFIKEIENGVVLRGKKTAPCTIECISALEGIITLTEGRYHEVKELFDRFRVKIQKLKRISFAGITLDENLKPGESRLLVKEEIDSLKKAVTGGNDAG